MGGGFGAQHQGTGSNLFLVDLENTILPGAVYKVLQIEDLTTNDIVNSTPGSPVVITPDTARGVNYRGALVYLNDLEGKITELGSTLHGMPVLDARKKAIEILESEGRIENIIERDVWIE